MPKRRTINWHEVDQPVSGLGTDVEHDICVQREAIPLIFVPGAMGTCLRRTGTDGTGDGPDDLPNLRWNPSSGFWMLWHFSGESGAHRKAMLIGPRFEPDYLEPNNSNPAGDGFAALMSDYCDKFLTPLKTHDWGPLGKIFVLPVYAVGYNWTDSAENSGVRLAARIREIIAEAKGITGLCEKVIVITHSMGGLVTRWASEMAGASGSILGVIHGVQPVTGAPAGYWRMKAGFEGFGMTSRVLGSSGDKVTPVLGNSPGGLQLLPNKLHRTNAGDPEWLTITQNGAVQKALPKSDPYKEIYQIKAVVRPKPGEKPSKNEYWALADPDLLDPGAVPPSNGNARDQVDAQALSVDPWPAYRNALDIAERFHDSLQKKAHAKTFCLRGVGLETADVIELAIESNWVRTDPYPARGFRGFFTNAAGKSMQAVLQDPAGDGDTTVPRSSGGALDASGKQLPGDRAIEVEHQPAFENADVQQWTFEAIKALCRMRYEERRHPLGDYPAMSATTGTA